MERSVSRSELQESPSSPEGDSQSENEAREKLRRLGQRVYDPLSMQDAATSQPAQQDHNARGDGGGVIGDGDNDEELDFKLFAGGKPSRTGKERSAATQKVRLHSPPAEASAPGFVNPRRHQDYYLAKPASIEEKEQFRIAAVTGPEIISRSNSPWPGMAYAWKVLHVPPNAVSPASRGQDESLFIKLMSSGRLKRTRPGKKTRIRRRSKTAAAEQQAEAKVVAEKEKRTRRNREKKVKKKARDKAKKEDVAISEANPDQASEHP